MNENVQLLAEFPSGLCMMITSATVNEQGLTDIIRGTKATLSFGGNKVELKPERPYSEEIDPESYDGLTPGESVAEHEKDWFVSIRTGKEPNANIDLAVKVQTIISLAEMSERLNITALFDEKTRKITTGDGREVKPLTYGSNGIVISHRSHFPRFRWRSAPPKPFLLMRTVAVARYAMATRFEIVLHGDDEVGLCAPPGRKRSTKSNESKPNSAFTGPPARLLTSMPAPLSNRFVSILPVFGLLQGIQR